MFSEDTEKYAGRWLRLGGSASQLSDLYTIRSPGVVWVSEFGCEKLKRCISHQALQMTEEAARKA